MHLSTSGVSQPLEHLPASTRPSTVLFFPGTVSDSAQDGGGCVSLCPGGCDEQSSWSPTVNMSLEKKQTFVVLNHRSFGVLWSEFPDSEPPGG